MEKLSVRHTFWFKMLFWVSVPFLHMFICRYQLTPLSSRLNLPTQAAWSLLVSMITFSVIQFFQIFRSLRLSPRKSDPLVLIVVLVAADLISKILLNGIIDIPDYFGMALFSRSIALAGAWYILGHAFTFALSQSNYRVRMGVFGTEEDLLYIKKAIKGFEAEKFLEFEIVHENVDVRNFHLFAYCPNQEKSERLDYLFIQLMFCGIPLLDIREVVEEFRLHVDLERNKIFDVMQSVKRVPLNTTLYLRAKSLFEPILAALLMVLLSPLFLLAAALVRLSGSGPILFTQRRLGVGGREFLIYKFRTMDIDAEADGAQWSSSEDPRITKIGIFLRKLHLDEIPQLWNIVRGDVSFVGPRPERPEFYEKLKQDIPLFYLRTVVRPGVTGWAQVFAGYANSIEGSKKKLAYDLHYIKGVSFRMDMISLVLTTVHVFNKFFLGEMALHEAKPLSSQSSKAILRSTVIIIILISIITLSISAIAFVKG